MIEVVDCSAVASDTLKRVVVTSEARTVAEQLGAWPWWWLLTGRSTRRVISKE